jgi:hypothetical protein
MDTGERVTTCPSCHATLKVVVVSPGSRTPHTLPSSGDEVAAVVAFTQRIEGRFTSSQLRDMYAERASEAGWPDMSAKMFGRCLRSVGARPWRGATGRGWEF